MKFNFVRCDNLRQIVIDHTTLYFVYEYCLSEVSLRSLCPTEKSIVVNLHDWNGNSCISNEAYSFANKINTELFTLEDLYEYIRSIRNC